MSLVGRLARTAASRTPCSHSSYATRPFWTRRLPSNSTPTRLRQTPNARRYYSVEKEVSQPEQGDAPTPLRNLPSSQPVKVAGLEIPSVDDPNFAVRMGEILEALDIEPSEGEYDEDYENDEEYDDQEEIDQEEEDDDRQDPSGRDFSHITESVALGLRKKEFPPSPAFYSGRMNYTDQVEALHRAVGVVQATLKDLHLYPLPAFALSKVEPGPAIWHQKAAMVEAAGNTLSSTAYRKLLVPLNTLHKFRAIARAASSNEVADAIHSIISPFESQAERLRIERRTYKKHVPLDEYGRTQTLGRRKTSHARVWIIPARTGKSQSGLTAPLEEAMGVSPGSSETSSQVVTTSVIINNMSLAQFFPFPTDREKVLRPLKVGGVLGAYNVFAIVRGGGTSGQAGAIAHGLAKGLVAHEPDLSTLFRRAKLSFRDPRQVERKKTNLLKARKRRAWRRR